MQVTNNLTPFSAISFPSVTHKGCLCRVICVSGRYKMPLPGKKYTNPILCDHQPEPVMTDVFSGKPGESSLLYEAQVACERPGTDIYLTGHAKSQKGIAVKILMIGLQVGPCKKRALVFGDRFWQKGAKGLAPSYPKSFRTMPVVYEKSFGGALPETGGNDADSIAENPVGCGYYNNASQAKDRLLPNIESIRHRITSITDHPSPVGFGPIARKWKPRADYAGSLDLNWVETKAPFWPDDFNPRFFQAASSELNTQYYLKGGETVNIVGFSYDGEYNFTLPKVKLQAHFEFNNGMEI